MTASPFQALADATYGSPSWECGKRDDAGHRRGQQSATAPRLFRRYAPNVLLWTVPSDKA